LPSLGCSSRFRVDAQRDGEAKQIFLVLEIYRLSVITNFGMAKARLRKAYVTASSTVFLKRTARARQSVATVA
jgi:hypothetical protein